MEHNKTFVRIILGVSGLAIAQGLVWAILSMIGLVAYSQSWEPIRDDKTHYDKLSNTLFAIFYAQETKLLVLLILYLIISLMWIITSALLMISVLKRPDNKTSIIFNIWSGSTMVTCLYDIIVIGILAADYQEGIDFQSKYDITLTYVLLAYGVLFSIAARGYVLWCVNLIFAVIVLSYAKRYRQAKEDVYQNSDHDYDHDLRRMFESRGNSNSGFDWERNSRPPTNQSNSFQRGYDRPQQYSNAPPKSNYSDRLSAYGRQQSDAQASVPSSKPTSYIYPKENSQMFSNAPNPRYAPPNSSLKSALKDRPTQNAFNFPRNGNGNSNYNGRY
ncbi:hypothetical protein FQR65_LT00836 [Abscondita terminalis]|nr:hypothetical protein FQR65_LT00836 [Abscondita terminalis]